MSLKQLKPTKGWSDPVQGFALPAEVGFDQWFPPDNTNWHTVNRELSH
jgi:hypothetical protein